MSTNYYLYSKSKEDLSYYKDMKFPLHIGKSSIGWHFLLHIFPKQGISSLEDWKCLFGDNRYVIHDEYRKRITKEQMLDIIINRKGNVIIKDERICKGDCRLGINNLLEHISDKYSSTGGTYDYSEEDFG